MSSTPIILQTCTPMDFCLKTFNEFSDLIFVRLKRQFVRAAFELNPYLHGQKRSNEVAKKGNHRHRFGVNTPMPNPKFLITL